MSNDVLKIALVQLNVTDDVKQNTETVVNYVREAKEKGAEFVFTPENTDYMKAPPPKDGSAHTSSTSTAMLEDQHITLDALRRVASELNLWISIGSLKVKIPDDTRVVNRSYLITSSGEIAARYDKIHMFDVTLATGEDYRESQFVRPGDSAVLCDTPWGRIGLTICYDVRFPHLYRTLAHAGATLLTVPAAFTRATGAAHWECLLRARAVENGCFVLAAAQCGVHAGGRQTYGHSMAVDPWGRVLADAGGERVGVTVLELQLGAVQTARQQVPSLQHDRPFTLVVNGAAAAAASSDV